MGDPIPTPTPSSNDEGLVDVLQLGNPTPSPVPTLARTHIPADGEGSEGSSSADRDSNMVGRCRITLSNPR
jgi:hypothetical protein